MSRRGSAKKNLITQAKVIHVRACDSEGWLPCDVHAAHFGWVLFGPVRPVTNFDGPSGQDVGLIGHIALALRSQIRRVPFKKKNAPSVQLLSGHRRVSIRELKVRCQDAQNNKFKISKAKVLWYCYLQQGLRQWPLRGALEELKSVGLFAMCVMHRPGKGVKHRMTLEMCRSDAAAKQEEGGKRVKPCSCFVAPLERGIFSLMRYQCFSSCWCHMLF